MAVIEFRTLGTLDLRRTDGHELHSLLAQPKRVALLAYLCLANPRGFHRRDTLLGLFWPDADQTHARSSLRNALHVLRHSLGETAVQSRGDEEVAVNFALIWCDAVAFEERIASDEVDGALDLYRGDLLTGFFLDDVPVFERWLESERTRLRAGAARAARVAAERGEAERNLTGAVNWARRAVELTDTDERAVRRLVELLARVGDRAGALQAYENFAQHLAAEFEAEPSAETRALVERLRSHQPAAANVDESHTSTPGEVASSRELSVPGYLIERELGRGGMATVFLARDLKHDRPVAIKVLRPDIVVLLGTDRFLTEIALAARLHHPHILPLLDSGKASELPYYIMPLVEGETLRSRLRRERFLPFEDAIRIACEVADALGYAHARGIIHRDIKPENILLENGHALVTDFGIARAISEAGGQRLTQTGLALGTAAYMSPEQADSAVELDARTDIYALACVLYEMLTGDPPFSGSTAQAVLARKAAEPAPPMRTVRDTISPILEHNVLKALSRAPADRFRTVKEFADVLRSQPPSDTSRVRSWPTIAAPRRIAASALIGLLLLIAALSIARAIKGGSRTGPEVRQKLTATGNAMMGSLSPDGQFLAYVAQAGDSQSVLVQDLAGGTPNTIKTMAGAVWSLEWSPDGSRLLLGGFKRAIVLARLGGQSSMIGPENGAQPMGFWLPDGRRVSVHQSGDRRILVFDPKTQDTLALPVKGNYLWLLEGSWSPTSRVFAMMTETGDPVSWELRTVTLDGKNELVVKDSVLLGSPRWSRDGSQLYYARGTDAVWRIAVSPFTGAARGTPEKIVTDLEMYVQRGALLHFALTPNGRGLLYARGARFSNLWLVERTEGETQPRTVALTTGTSLRWSPVVSPDGNTIAFAQEGNDVAELFTMPISGGSPAQVTSGAQVRPESHIAWSPDGSQIAFSTVRSGHAQVWVATVADGTLRAFAQTRTGTPTGHLTWAPGSSIAYQNTDKTTINLIDPASGEERTVIQSPPDGFVYSPSYSPGGNSLAVVFGPGVNNGLPGIYVFNVRTSAFTRVNGGGYPRGWSPDSRFIYFQLPQSPIIHRLDSRGGKKGKIFLTPPFRVAQCRPVGATRPNAFICAAFDFASDIWRIDNFDHNEK